MPESDNPTRPMFPQFYVLFCFSLIFFTHFDVSEHGGQVVCLGAQVKVVEDVLLHVVQVRVLNILLLSVRGNIMNVIHLVFHITRLH